MNKLIPLEEQETVICIQPPQISRYAEVYTCIPNMLKKILKLAETRPECVTIKKDLGNAVIADVDRSCIRIAPKRTLTDEQRAAATERLAKGREKKT